MNGEHSIPYEIGVSRISSENCIEIEKSLSELFNRERNIPWPEINVLVQIISAVVQQSYLQFKYPNRTSLPYTDNYASDEITRFIGYAIYKTRCSWHKKATRRLLGFFNYNTSGKDVKVTLRETKSHLPS